MAPNPSPGAARPMRISVAWQAKTRYPQALPAMARAPRPRSVNRPNDFLFWISRDPYPQLASRSESTPCGTSARPIGRDIAVVELISDTGPALDNKLLASLPRSQFERLQPHLVTVAPSQGAVLCEAGDEVGQVYEAVCTYEGVQELDAPRPASWGGGFGFRDPEGNRVETFWLTGLPSWAMIGVPINIDRPDDEVMAEQFICRWSRATTADRGSTAARHWKHGAWGACWTCRR